MGSMDNSPSKLRQRPPPQDAELPAPPEGGGRQVITLSGHQLRALAVLVLVADYFNVAARNFGEGAYDAPGAPLRWRLPAVVALAYAAVAALIWLLGRLERRRLPDDRDARWEKRVNVAAQILAYAIVTVLAFYSASMAPCALYVFLWVGSRDDVYIGLTVKKE